jgi:hypothetical protein
LGLTRAWHTSDQNKAQQVFGACAEFAREATAQLVALQSRHD